MKLRAENITVGYGKKAVISNVNFSCETGQLIALMGLNGCGKSTLLNSLSGMQALLAGELFLDTEPVANWSLQEKAQRIAIVTTGRLQAANMTAFEVAAMGRYPYTGLFGKLKPQDVEIVEFSMQQCGLELLKNREFNTLSDGEQQRVLIARALAQQTPLIFLDEPTSYLDVRGKAEVLDLLQKLATNHLIVFSTHEVSIAPRVTTHFWLIDETSNFSSHTAKEVADGQLLEKLFYKRQTN